MGHDPTTSFATALGASFRSGFEGALEVRARGTGAAVTIQVKDQGVVFVTSSTRQPMPGEDLGAYITNAVVDLFGADDLEVTSDPTAISLHHDGTIVPIADLMLRGMLRIEDGDCLLRWLGGRLVVVSARVSLEGVFTDELLEPGDRDLFKLLTKPKPLAEVLSPFGPKEWRVLRVVAALYLLSALDVDAPRVARTGTPGPDLAASSNRKPLDMERIARSCFAIEEKYQALRTGADHYAVLEVGRKATREEIKASYRALAKLYHPDHFNQLANFDSSIKDRLDAIFTALSVAYATLSNHDARSAYDTKRFAKVADSKVPQKTSTRVPLVKPLDIDERQPKRPSESRAETTSEKTEAGPPTNPTMSAREFFDRGRSFAQAEDFERAARAFRQAVDLAPENSEYRVHHGAALAELHGLGRESIMEFRRALELNPKSVQRYVEVASVYRRFGRTGDARILLKRAQIIDPENTLVRDELGVVDDESPGRVASLLRGIWRPRPKPQP